MEGFYSDAVRRNLLAGSISQKLPNAFSEWRFTGQARDHRTPVAVCQLCEHEELRYQFEIKNDFTDAKLWVGSQCILKFGVAVYEESERLSPEDARSKLNSLTKQLRFDACMAALGELAAAESNDILRNALNYYQQHGHLTPKYAFVVFWRLRANSIDHSPSFFKISLRREAHRDALAAMPDDRVELIWPALTASQRKLARQMGKTGPGR